MLEKYHDVMNVDEMCEAIQIGKNTAYYLLKTKQVKHKKIGRIYKIPKKYLIEYIELIS